MFDSSATFGAKHKNLNLIHGGKKWMPRIRDVAIQVLFWSVKNIW